MSQIGAEAVQSLLVAQVEMTTGVPTLMPPLPLVLGHTTGVVAPCVCGGLAHTRLINAWLMMLPAAVVSMVTRKVTEAVAFTARSPPMVAVAPVPRRNVTVRLVLVYSA